MGRTYVHEVPRRVDVFHEGMTGEALLGEDEEFHDVTPSVRLPIRAHSPEPPPTGVP